VACVLHTHSRAGAAVSAQKCGILPISQQSTLVLSSLAYHDYEGVAVRDEEKPRLQNDLGSRMFYMLRNHGLLTVGRDIPEAFLLMYVFELVCRIQIDAQAGGELVHIPQSIIDGAVESINKGNLGRGLHIAWPALLRKLDRIDSSYQS